MNPTPNCIDTIDCLYCKCINLNIILCVNDPDYKTCTF